MKVDTEGLNADQIFPGMWQGAYPPEGSMVALAGFKVVVFCAKEAQPSPRWFPGVEVILAPNDDDGRREVTASELRIAIHAARKVAKAIQANQPTLVTCQMGWNRSGLVSAIALHLLTGKSGAECLKHVQMCRKNALHNPSFQRVLREIKARRMSPQPL